MGDVRATGSHESYAPLSRLVVQVTVYGLGVLGVLC